MPQRRAIKTVEDYINELPDAVLSKLTFSMPWQYDSGSSGYPDPDGFVTNPSNEKEDTSQTRTRLQKACWDRSIGNPQVNTNVRRLMGRLAGRDFGVFSDVPEIQEVIEEIEEDYRNRLYLYYPKYVARATIEGELFNLLTVHPDGFIETDFIDPSNIQDSTLEYGIIFHPIKTTMPLFYAVSWDGTGTNTELIPSIFVARNPDLEKAAFSNPAYSREKTMKSRDNSSIFGKLGGFYRFITSWDKSFITQRNVSHLRTTIKWLNHYENLKLYEIDHKKSSGSYLWIIEMTDPKTFRQWLALSDEDKRKTGIMAKKTPGSTLVLPPGMKATAINPQLPKISDSDTDILGMVSAGLNEPEDVTMGSSKSTFSSVKASRGPMSDRDSDEAWWYEQYLRFDFWGSIFFLRASVRDDFPFLFPVQEAVGFKRVEVDVPNDPLPTAPQSSPKAANRQAEAKLAEKAKPVVADPKPIDPGTHKEIVKEPVVRRVKKKPEKLIEINFPTSEVVDIEARSRAYLGVKHGSISDTMHIPRKEIARRLGFGNYYRLLLQHATEEYKYPTPMETIDQESQQEKTEAEPSPSKVKRTPIPTAKRTPKVK